MSLYPVMLHGESIAALVVGGGPVATRKVAALLAAGATVRVVAPELCDELRAAASPDARLRLTERPFEDGDLDGATLVVAATGDRATNGRIGRLAGAAGLLVNVVDAPEEGTFVSAATHRAGDLVVAVAGGGVPSAAARVRDILARRIDDRYGDAVAQLGALRTRLLERGQRAEWRLAAEQLAGSDFAEMVESGRLAERVKRWA